MITGISYEDVLMAAARAAPCEKGLYLTQMCKIADELGVELVVRKKGRYDTETARGILHVSNKRKQLYHVVILDRGRVIETDASLWDADIYLATKRFAAGSLLVLEDG
jgi:hypothetical protein